MTATVGWRFKNGIMFFIRLSGAIGTGARALNDEGMAPVIEKAFAKGKPV
ncbi:MAG: S49 family peptidase, partial [Pseudomonadota bacterium]